MNRSELLGSAFDCECGRHHHVPTKSLFYTPQAYDILAQTVAESSTTDTCLIIADKRTWEAAGKDVHKSLASTDLKTSCLIIPDKDKESPAADDAYRDYILEHAQETGLYIAVGSGVINDLVKWVAFLRNTPFITVPTAASMNGYASANVAATVDGLKVLFHAEACRAVFAVPQVINSAPDELTSSGLGDVLAKSVSSADWRLNQLIFHDYFCQYSVDLLKDLEPIYLENPDGIYQKDPVALKALFEALFYSSIAMTMTGTSSVASGGEHMISHTLDMIAGRDKQQHDLHGRQVGIGSILTAAIYEKVMEIDTPVFVDAPQQVNEEFWGSLSPIVEKEYRQKLVRIDEAANFLAIPENWQEMKNLIQPGLVSASRLKSCLSEAGAAHRFSDIRVDGFPLKREKFVEVVKHANQMRQRFTILDLAVMLGIIPDALESLIEIWVSE